MIVNQKELELGLKKAKGIVNDANVIEELKHFYFSPDGKGKLSIAGSDGNLTILTSVVYQPSEESDGSPFTISADKLLEFVHYADEDITFAYTEDSQAIELMTGAAKMVIRKSDVDFSFIKFDLFDTDEFDDEVNREEFLFNLNNLLPITQNNSMDVTNQTIFFDGKKAYAFENTLCYIQFETTKQYMIGNKAARQIATILSESESEMVKLKYIDDDTQVFVSTGEDNLSFRVFETSLLDVEEQINTEFTDSFIVEYSELLKAINRASIVSEENYILIEITNDSLDMNWTSSNGESSESSVPILKSSVSKSCPKSIEIYVPVFLKLLKIIRSEVTVIKINSEYGMCRINDQNDIAVAITTITEGQ